MRPHRSVVSAKQQRNAPCACGSGKKFKHCCGAVGGAASAGASMPPQQAAQRQFRLGVQHLNAGQTGLAVGAFLDAIRLDGTHGEAFHALGTTLLQAGKIAEATPILARAAMLRPDDAQVHRDLATAYDRQDLRDQAIDAYRRAADLTPRDAAMQLRLGQLYASVCRMGEAGDCLNHAADLRRGTAEAELYRSDARMLSGELAAAEQHARKALAIDPANSAGHAGLGGLLYMQGRFDEAAACYQSALQHDPALAKAWQGLAQCRNHAGAGTALLDRMSAALNGGRLPDETRMAIHFAMGKIHDDQGDYASAMAHFDAAAQLRAKGPPFDRVGLAALVDRNIRLFTPAFFARHAALGVADPLPLFIAGMYRSGTTLVERIVSGHPAIAAGGELTIWSPTDLEPDAASGAFDPTRAQAAVARYLSALRAIGPSAARVTDKLPPNIFRLGAIHTLLPQARIIHCRRDPIDTCLSIYATLFSTHLSFAARKDDLVFYVRQYRRMVDHWRAVLPGDRFMDVDYEALISDRAAQTRRLIEFAGVDWDDGCLSPEKNARPIGTASAWQARQPVYATSVERWRRYEPWLGELRQLHQ